MMKEGIISRAMLSTTIGGALSLLAGPALAENFNIEAQPAATAIPEFARQAGLQIMVPAKAAGRKRTNAVHGEMDRGEALNKLIRGTGLHIRSNDGKTVLLAFQTPVTQPVERSPGRSDSAAAAVVLSGETAEKPQLEEIIVTAQRRAENILEVPITVSSFSDATLASRGIGDMTALAEFSPGLKFGQSDGTVLPFIRGVGNKATGFGNESSVATYLDGVYYSRLPSGLFSLANIERIEVLRGPQGTLFGRNSTGGVLNIITSDPSSEPTAKGELGYGNYNTFQGSMYASTGIGDIAAASISVAGRHQGKGYGVNLAGYPTAFRDFAVIRGKLVVRPTDTTKITLSGFYGDTKGSNAGGTFPGTTRGYNNPARAVAVPTVGFYDQTSLFTPHNQSKNYGATLRLDQDLGFANLISITAYLKSKALYLNSNYAPEVNDLRYGSITRLPGLQTQTTQEVQLQSPSSSELTWVIGYYYYDSTADYDYFSAQGPRNIPPGTAGLPQGDVLFDDVLNDNRIYGKQHARSHSVYGQFTYELFPRFDLTGGLRYTHDRIRAIGHTVRSLLNGAVQTTLQPETRGRDSRSKVTYRVSADYGIAANANVYASYSRGYKSANFNLIPVSGIATKPEIIDAYEIGFKTELFDRRLRLNAAAYYYDITNPQVQLIANTGLGNVLLLSNAGASRSKGFEFNGTYNASSALTLDFGIAYTDSRYTRYGSRDANGNCIACAPSGFPPIAAPPYGAPNPLRAIVAAGKRTPYSPELTAYVGIQYVVSTGEHSKWTVGADYAYSSAYYFEPDNFLRQGDYHMLNARLEYSPVDALFVRAWGKNLLGEKVIDFGGTQAGVNGYIYAPRQPLTYGVTLGFKY